MDELLSIDDGLSEWAVGFAESLGQRVIDQGLPLTPRQRAKAEEILKEQGR